MKFLTKYYINLIHERFNKHLINYALIYEKYEPYPTTQKPSSCI